MGKSPAKSKHVTIETAETLDTELADDGQSIDIFCVCVCDNIGVIIGHLSVVCLALLCCVLCAAACVAK